MTNEEAIGYMLAACQSLGITDFKLVEELRSEMYYMFDVKTESEAYNVGRAYVMSLQRKKGEI